MKGELEGGGVEGGRGGGLGGPSRPQGPSAHLLHTHTHRSIFPLALKEAAQICIILRILNFHPVSYSYFNKATNQW